MNGKTAKNLRALVRAQFQGNVNPQVIRKIYRRTKTAWNKTPVNQRHQFKLWLQTASNLYKTINKHG